MSQANDFLGRGWGFPPTFNKQTKAVKLLSGAEDIESSLHILLSTTVGERIMQPRYGCNLKKFIFDPLNTSMTNYIRKLVDDAILYFEPRITVEGLQVNLVSEEGRMDILIAYRIKSSNSRSNFVYPFYYNEGSEL